MVISDIPFPAGVRTHTAQDATQQAQALAAAVAKALDQALEHQDNASLLVSGGRSPIAFFEALSEYPLAWTRIQVGLVDERWVAPDQPGSNEALVRTHLLRHQATLAQFVGLYTPASHLEQAADQASQNLLALKRPVDVVVLGMGEDGHTASLFPGNSALAQALAPDGSALCLPMQAPVAPHPRLTLTYPVLSAAQHLFLAVQGMAKLETLNQALQLEPCQMPIRAFLDQSLELYWCP